MNPEICKYTQDHEWVFMDNNIATIGISDYAAKELGEVVFVELPEANESINQKGEFGTVESVKTVSSVYSPISGTITDTNTELEDNPNLVNEDPQGSGWIIKLQIADVTELDDLMTYEEYQHYLETL